MSGLIQAVRKKQLDRTWLCVGISPVRVTYLVQVSKDAASLVVCTRKKIFWLWDVYFLWVMS